VTARLWMVVAAFTLPLVAQWPSYPARGVPRTADGKANLNAPAPRTAYGKPDLTGIWEVTRPVGAVLAS